MNATIAAFSNLGSAGAELAVALPRTRLGGDVIVLGIVAAGIPAAVKVANYLSAPLDVVIIRRLLTPEGPGTQATAVNVAGSLVIDEEIGPQPATPKTPFEYFVADALNALAKRAQACRGLRPAIDLAGKNVLIVDCGIRTGLTMRAAIDAIRTLDPARITAAVPVTSQDGGELIRSLADELVYLAAPEPFVNAGFWYKDFSRPADDSISELLRPGLSSALTQL